MKTLIMGSSTNPQRYAYKAAESLVGKGFEIELFGRRKGEIFGKTIKTSLEEIDINIDTVTMYLSESNQEEFVDFILNLKPRRVIFNPGAENPDFAERLNLAGIEPINACTLVMLSIGQY